MGAVFDLAGDVRGLGDNLGMARSPAVDPVTAERITRHGFVNRPARTVAEATRLTTAVQAQDPLQSRFGLRSRGTGFTETDVLAAIEDRTVVRTWLMRATIHLVAAEDARWLTRVIGPSFARRFRKRWLDIGLTPAVLDRTAAALPEVLADGPLTKNEIVERLRARRVTFPMDDPQAPIHVLIHATGLGLVCRGPERGRDSTFALLDQWLARAPEGPSGDEALAELARRYFGAFAPATAADFTTWSGLPSTRAIELIRGELEPTDVGGRAGFRPKDTPSVPRVGPGAVRLAAGYDNYLVGYRDRSLFITDHRRPQVYVGGVIKPTILLDGRVIGTWRLTRSAPSPTVELTPFEPVTRATQRAIDAEIEDVTRFLDR